MLQQNNPDTISEFKKTILDNYYSQGRSFLWRETSDPYHIMVSEFMLQQTQTERVVSKYREWLTVFPSIEILAAASLQQVLEQWAGLGYNRRARYLHQASKIICDTYNGSVPHDPETLDALPGIGPYTARAITTFSWNTPHIFIETNIRAVFIFFFFQNTQNAVHDKDVIQLVEASLDYENPRIWYYALMDYGALLKKKVANPNRISAHYTVQSKFEGSIRQARGAVIRYLGRSGEADLTEISTGENIDCERIEKAVKALIREGLVAEKKGKYYIGC